MKVAVILGVVILTANAYAYAGCVGPVVNGPPDFVTKFSQAHLVILAPCGMALVNCPEPTMPMNRIQFQHGHLLCPVVTKSVHHARRETTTAHGAARHPAMPARRGC